MKQSKFVEKNTKTWETAKLALSGNENVQDIPENYRLLSQHLSIARTRGYSKALIKYLKQLVIQHHNILHAQKNNWFINIWLFFSVTFPVSVRKHKYLVLLSSLLFFVPLIAVAVLIYFNVDIVSYLIPNDQLQTIQDMYDPDKRVIGREREEDGDWYMFGFYIYNNTSIGFRTFAAGLLMGFGSAFLLLFNAIFIGAIAGYLINIGYHQTFFSFVSGHSSFELVAIVLSGAAGFILGYAIIHPGNLRRKLALQYAAKQAMPVMQGAMSFFFIAAMIEAFWSSNVEIPFMIKVIVGSVLWVIILLYLFLAGKKKAVKHE